MSNTQKTLDAHKGVTPSMEQFILSGEEEKRQSNSRQERPSSKFKHTVSGQSIVYTDDQIKAERERRSMLIYGVPNYLTAKIERKKMLEGNKKGDAKKILAKTFQGVDMNSSIIEDQNEEAKMCIISQDSGWKKLFDKWMTILVGYSCFSTVFYCAFGARKLNLHLQSVDTEDALGIFIVDHIVLAFFIIDIILEFFVEKYDTEQQEMLDDHKSIAMKYIKSGFFFVDIIATFPYELVTGSYYTSLFRLFRLFRLPELFRMLDFSNSQDQLSKVFKNDTRGRRVILMFILINILKILNLIMMTITIIYFIGCLWFIISDTLNTDFNNEIGYTYIQAFGLNLMPFDFDRFITSSYFIITTLAVIGYGDLYPKSNIEKIFTMFIMMFGVAFFAYIMGNFITIVRQFDDLTGEKDESTDLHQWLSLLNRFTQKKTIRRSLQTEIDDHFKHYWANDRLVTINEKSEFLKALPRIIKKNIMVQFLFDDVFYKFKNFFKTRKNSESKFLYDIAFNLKPRQFMAEKERCVIYDEEDEVPEMYFINKGSVGIGYYLYSKNPTDQSFKVGIIVNEGGFLCDYYVCYNKKSQFVYAAQSEVQAYALSKRYLQNYIFEKYPEIATEIKEDSYYNYKKNVMQKMLKYRNEHIEEVNKASSYKTIQINQRDDFGSVDHESEITLTSTNNDLNLLLQKRMAVIQDEMSKLGKQMHEFASVCDQEFNRLVQNIDLIQQGKRRLHSFSFQQPFALPAIKAKIN